MADLTSLEKRQLERLLGMGGGYVLNFTNRTFEEFVFDSVGKQIYSDQYAEGSGSKANRLRALVRLEPNHLVAKLITDLIEFGKAERQLPDDPAVVEACQRTATRLAAGAPVFEVETAIRDLPGGQIDVLARKVQEAIDKNEPDLGLDRLHTFTIRFHSAG